MTKTILESFRKLKTNLEITELQQSTVSTRQQNVRKAVENELNVLDSFLTGVIFTTYYDCSFKRG